jgi:hypothetical protein
MNERTRPALTTFLTKPGMVQLARSFCVGGAAKNTYTFRIRHYVP